MNIFILIIVAESLYIYFLTEKNIKLEQEIYELKMKDYD